ncbi:uncharacterized protein PV07_09228 [Cladophialophora immunda]|uniref:Xylanolytic transcriptional activator regulatory domain-containing protein n=1 Tax=Cladophialophora immunda TaxID=569365 RepID=A0A0D1ZEG4_9EURO|nr:uncharacterized protein PV07_09228 [Cladophialophora immunda]KIW26101.1 hypothetical protein PV07_09228 [Cladophialophora immunda]
MQVPVAESTSESQSWDTDAFSAEEQWLPLEMDMANLDLPEEQPTEDAGWGLPDQVAGELIGNFFDNVQTWLGFVHRPTFYRRYMRCAGQQATLIGRPTLSDDESFMIYAMFAMAARFSTSEHFTRTPIHDRGERFANHAATIKDSIIKTVEEPSLEFVQGCVMLAFYNFAAGQFGPGVVLSSVCVRFAYELCLDETDEDQLDEEGLAIIDMPHENAESWLKKEEKRRLWWSIWELDTFASTCSFHPFNIERAEMKVLLPAPNHNWHCSIPARTAFIGPPESAWNSLQKSPGQSTRAWFLVANYLKSTIIFQSRRSFRHGTISRCRLETALCNLKLSLPDAFHLRSLYLDADNHQDAMWVIATHLMIMT